MPGAPTLSAATAGDRQVSLAFTAPSSNGGSAITSYSATCTAGSVSVSASGSGSPLVVMGLTNGTTYSCTVLATNAVGNSVASTAVTATPAAATSSDAASFAPTKFSSVINLSYSASSLSTATAFTSKKRYLIADGASTPSFWTTGTKGTNAYPLVGTTLGSGPIYKDYLSKTVQAVVDSSDSTCFRLDAHLHSNYSIDVDTTSSNALVFRNNWALSPTSGHGYVCFAYDSGTKLLTARKRYNYNASDYSHTQDTSFGLTGYYVNYTSGVAKLVASSAQATPLTLYASPINFDMPLDFNANGSAGSSNSAMPYSTSYQKITASYLQNIVAQAPTAIKKQISADLSTATIGYNATTVAQQDAMLATIESTAKANGFALRYPIATYKVFRDAALQYKLYGDSIVDGTLGENTVPMVYFTNPKDASGVYHPAMIVVGYSVPETPHYLADVIKPPGGGDASITICNQGLGSSVTGYTNQCVTRAAVRQNFFFRVPMKDYGLTTSLCDNTMAASLYSDANGTSGSFCNTAAAKPTTVENYASIADNGVMIDGTSAYPVLNNVLITSQEEPSLNMHGCHVGQGYGYHCHADGFSAVNNGMSLYNDPDYASKNHPPLIGFGFDGIALYGRYLAKYPNMVGYTASNTSATSTAVIAGNDLDVYGGHTHLIDGVSVYHQHARPYSTVTLAQGGQSGGRSYFIHSLITGAWRGKINAIPNFWDGTKPNTKGQYPLLTD